MKFRNVAFLFIAACAALICTLNSEAAARVWTLSELDTLSSREWLWIDKTYTEPISEYYTETEGPDKLPVRSDYIAPKYPKEASKTGAEGSVWVKILVDEKGKVRVARILEDSGTDVGFEDAALAAAIKSKWKPAIKDGKRIPVWVAYKSAFYLNMTDDGRPIRQINRWHWIAAGDSVYFSHGLNWQEPANDDIPGIDDSVGVEVMPVKVKDPKISYPEAARKLEMDGSVWVKVLVSRSGRVAQAMVAKESGCDCGFEESALWAAINSKWKPAMFDKKPIALWVTYEIRFELRH